jgi:hypothetical protein
MSDKIPKDVQEILERRGVDSVKALLVSMANGAAGTGRGAALTLDGKHVLRGQMEDWLRDKETVSSRWIKTGALAAIAAAILALLSWLLPLK